MIADAQIEEFMRRRSNISRIIDSSSTPSAPKSGNIPSAKLTDSLLSVDKSVMSEFRQRLMDRLESRSKLQTSFEHFSLHRLEGNNSDEEIDNSAIFEEEPARTLPVEFRSARTLKAARAPPAQLTELKLSSFKKPKQSPLFHQFDRVYTYEDDEHSTHDLLSELKRERTNGSATKQEAIETADQVQTQQINHQSTKLYPIIESDKIDKIKTKLPLASKTKIADSLPLLFSAVVLLLLVLMIFADFKALFLE